MATTTGDALFNAIAEVLTSNGPVGEPRLIPLLQQAGVDLGPDPAEALLDVLEDSDERLAELTENRWAWVPALLADRVFTHRLAGWEVEYDCLAGTPDLTAMLTLLDVPEERQLADGSPVAPAVLPFYGDLLDERGVPAEEVDTSECLLLPRGYLSGMAVRAGDVIGLRLTGRGLALESIHDVPTKPAATVGQALCAILADHEPIEVSTAVLTACADDPALFTEPGPPLAATMESSGLSVYGDWLATDAYDFSQHAAESRLDRLARQYQLDDDQSLAMLAVLELYERVAEARAATNSGDSAPMSALVAQSGLARTADSLTLLIEPIVAEAVFVELDLDAEEAGVLSAFVEAVDGQLHPATRPALRWLGAKAYELAGDLVTAEKMLLEAEKLNPHWPLALRDLAGYASDRGDAVRGIALLRQGGITTGHRLYDVLTEFQPVPRKDLGRNKPCWCGSGRKYKVCHLNSERLPLDVRAAWLYQKAAQHLLERDWRGLLVGLATARSEYSGTVREALGAPLITDATLFEGGGFADFLDVRGTLLPEDERLLAEQWLLVERSVYEIKLVRPGIGFTVRDLRTGDVHEVAEATASRELTAGAMICARVVPAGDTMQIIGGIEPVGLRERDQLIEVLDSEPGPYELIAFLSARFAPPILTNTEGDPIVMCEATLSVPDVAALCQALDGAYERAEEELTWIDHVTTDGMERIRATLSLDNQLHVRTNSEKRLDLVLDHLRTLDPTLTVVDETRRRLRDTDDAAGLARQDGVGASADPDDPAIAAAMKQFVLNYEQKWLDDSIPALAGQTPRQAAADPTRRDDLIRLLDSLPDPAGDPGRMNPERLRAALGLAH
jgi:hypothetical protein